MIQDAVRRDRALDAFEAAKGARCRSCSAQGQSRIEAIEDEIQSFLKAKNAELEDLKRATEGAGQAFRKLQARKRHEEDRLFDVVSHFVAGVREPRDHVHAPTAPASPPPTKPGPA